MFSGKEDLGGGSAVLVKLENGFNADTGAQANATTLFDKQAFIGLQGDWGTVRAGRPASSAARIASRISSSRPGPRGG